MAPAAEQQGICMAKADEQRQAYVQLLRSLLHDVVEVPADVAHPGKYCEGPLMVLDRRIWPTAAFACSLWWV
jgi:hypothetical protein